MWMQRIGAAVYTMLQGCRVNHFPRALQSFVHFLLFIRTSQNLSSEVCGGFPLRWHISHSWLGGLFDSLRLCFLSNHLGKIISSDEIKMPQNCSGLDKHRPKTYTLEEEALVPKALCALGKSQRDGSSSSGEDEEISSHTNAREDCQHQLLLFSDSELGALLLGEVAEHPAAFSVCWLFYLLQRVEPGGQHKRQSAVLTLLQQCLQVTASHAAATDIEISWPLETHCCASWVNDALKPSSDVLIFSRVQRGTLWTHLWTAERSRAAFAIPAGQSPYSATGLHTFWPDLTGRLCTHPPTCLKVLHWFPTSWNPSRKAFVTTFPGRCLFFPYTPNNWFHIKFIIFTRLHCNPRPTLHEHGAQCSLHWRIPAQNL